jgi:hypothetical protein
VGRWESKMERDEATQEQNVDRLSTCGKCLRDLKKIG